MFDLVVNRPETNPVFAARSAAFGCDQPVYTRILRDQLGQGRARTAASGAELPFKGMSVPGGGTEVGFRDRQVQV
jgi:hypothetical protein